MLELYGDMLEPLEPQQLLQVGPSQAYITQTAPDTTQTTTQTASDTTQTTTQTASDTTQTLTIQEQIIRALTENPSLSRKDIAMIIDSVSEDGVKYHLKKLQDKGILRRIGPDFGGHWEIIRP